MKNKRMMSAAMAVLMVGSLAACGGSTTASTPASTASLPLGVVIIGLATAILFKTQNAWVHYEAE